MASPFPKSASSAGNGKILVNLQPNGASGLANMTYQYPLKLISPSASTEATSALVFLLSYGGGLVGGDCVSLQVDIQQSAKLSLVTQGHTKIFKSPSPEVVTQQTLNVRIEDGAGLCLLPDPVQPFRDSVYKQVQIFRLAPDASLCLLDWVTEGRSARGENWSFVRWHGKNEVWVGEGEADKGRLLVRDSVLLEGDRYQIPNQTLREIMQSNAVFGTLILRGPMMKRLGDFFMAEFTALPRIGARDFEDKGGECQKDSGKDAAWRRRRLHLENKERVLWSSASIRGCVVVKFGSRTVEGGRMWLGSMLAHQGDIATSFGAQALMCVR